MEGMIKETDSETSWMENKIKNESVRETEMS